MFWNPLWLTNLPVDPAVAGCFSKLWWEIYLHCSFPFHLWRSPENEKKIAFSIASEGPFVGWKILHSMVPTACGNYWSSRKSDREIWRSSVSLLLRSCFDAYLNFSASLVVCERSQKILPARLLAHWQLTAQPQPPQLFHYEKERKINSKFWNFLPRDSNFLAEIFTVWVKWSEIMVWHLQVRVSSC